MAFNCPLRASPREMSSMLNIVALIADAVAIRAATDTATNPHTPKTGKAACATAVSACLSREDAETLVSTTYDSTRYKTITTPIARKMARGSVLAGF